MNEPSEEFEDLTGNEAILIGRGAVMINSWGHERYGVVLRGVIDALALRFEICKRLTLLYSKDLSSDLQ